MAGHDDGNRIARIAMAYCPGCAWPADAAGKFRIRNGMAVWDIAQLPPYNRLKCRAFGCQRQVELRELAIEIGLQLRNRTAKRLRHIITDPAIARDGTMLVIIGMQAGKRSAV